MLASPLFHLYVVEALSGQAAPAGSFQDHRFELDWLHVTPFQVLFPVSGGPSSTCVGGLGVVFWTPALHKGVGTGRVRSLDSACEISNGSSSQRCRNPD